MLLICVVKIFETHSEVSLWYGSGPSWLVRKTGFLLMDTESLRGEQTYWLNSRIVYLTCNKLAFGSEHCAIFKCPITQSKDEGNKFQPQFYSLYFTELRCFERALAYNCGQGVGSPYLRTWVLWGFGKSTINGLKRGVRTVVCRIWLHFSEVFMGGSYLPCSISLAWKILIMWEHWVGPVGLSMLVWVTSHLWHLQNHNACKK